jgi:hypothetical protein
MVKRRIEIQDIILIDVSILAEGKKSSIHSLGQGTIDWLSKYPTKAAQLSSIFSPSNL